MPEKHPKVNESRVDLVNMPRSFVGLVRNALMHLYDQAHLQCHPLAELVTSDGCAPENIPRALRGLLIDAIEELNPGPLISRNDREWRPYGILIRRYVNGFSIEEVASELHLSVRQFHREHHKALLALSAILWQRWQARKGARPDGKSSASVASQLTTEIQRLGVTLERMDLAAALRENLKLAESLARHYHSQLEAVIPTGSIWVWADPTLCRQALLTGISSFVSAESPILTIRCEAQAGYGWLAITAQPSSPGRGQRAVSERESRLAALRELLAAQGGKLEVSQEGPFLTSVRLAFRRHEGRRVLLIDDDARLVHLFARYLTAEGYSVLTAGSGAEALSLVEAEEPEAIVLDVMMRDIDGWEFLERLRASPKLRAVPILICSVLEQPELAQMLGARCYLKKPVSTRQLSLALRQALRSSSQGARCPEAH